MNYGGVNKNALTDQTRMSKSLDISQGFFCWNFIRQDQVQVLRKADQ